LYFGQRQKNDRRILTQNAPGNKPNLLPVLQRLFPMRFFAEFCFVLPAFMTFFNGRPRCCEWRHVVLQVAFEMICEAHGYIPYYQTFSYHHFHEYKHCFRSGGTLLPFARSMIVFPSP